MNTNWDEHFRAAQRLVAKPSKRVLFSSYGIMPMAAIAKEPEIDAFLRKVTDGYVNVSLPRNTDDTTLSEWWYRFGETLVVTQTYGFHLTVASHSKLIATNRQALIGSFNFTRSDWVDHSAIIPFSVAEYTGVKETLDKHQVTADYFTNTVRQPNIWRIPIGVDAGKPITTAPRETVAWLHTTCSDTFFRQQMEWLCRKNMP